MLQVSFIISTSSISYSNTSPFIPLSCRCTGECEKSVEQTLTENPTRQFIGINEPICFLTAPVTLLVITLGKFLDFPLGETGNAEKEGREESERWLSYFLQPRQIVCERFDISDIHLVRQN